MKGDQIPGDPTVHSIDNRLWRCHAHIGTDANFAANFDPRTDGDTGATHQYSGARGHLHP